MRSWIQAAALATISVIMPWTTTPEAATAVSVPLSCTKGPSGQRAEMLVTVPPSVEEGAVFTVRFDGKNSGTVSHTGLRYIHDMTTQVLVPNGTAYVEGSARIIPNTGTPNVRDGAKVTKQGGIVTLLLPGQVNNGDNYTPPSFELKLQVTAAAGAKIEQRFWQYKVTAKAVIIGDVLTVCDPTPKPYTIASTTVTAKEPAP